LVTGLFRYNHYIKCRERPPQYKENER
jgi:hypothetical protein